MSEFRHAFARASARQERETGIDFIDAIRRERPDLQHEKVEDPRQGEMAHTAILGQEVFKGPKRHYGVHQVDDEVWRLRTVEGKGLPYPVVTYVSENFAIYSMTKMPGVTLLSMLPHLTAEEKQLLAKDLVDALIGTAKVLPTRDGLYGRHGDMHAENILVDPDTHKLTGIVDFGIVELRSREHLGAGWVRGELGPLVAHEYQQRKTELPALKPKAEDPRHD